MRKVIAVIVKNGEVLSWATNDHDNCKREGYPTGEGYELCEGCDYPNHAEVKALRGIDAKGATMYLFGHYYACDNCDEVIKNAGVTLKLK